MAFDAVLDTPLKRFWFLVNQIDRLKAEENLRLLQVTGAANDAEAIQIALENLKNEMGQVFVWEEQAPSEIRIDPETDTDPEFDKGGLERLKALSGLREGQTV